MLFYSFGRNFVEMCMGFERNSNQNNLSSTVYELVFYSFCRNFAEIDSGSWKKFGFTTWTPKTICHGWGWWRGEGKIKFRHLFMRRVEMPRRSGCLLRRRWVLVAFHAFYGPRVHLALPAFPTRWNLYFAHPHWPLLENSDETRFILPVSYTEWPLSCRQQIMNAAVQLRQLLFRFDLPSALCPAVQFRVAPLKRAQRSRVQINALCCACQGIL